MNNPLTKWAVQYVCYQLKKDEGYWQAWQANIAMAFIDEIGEEAFRGLSDEHRLVMHQIADKAATAFLNRLTETSRHI